MRRRVWSRNRKNEGAMARVGPQRHRRKKIKVIKLLSTTARWKFLRKKGIAVLNTTQILFCKQEMLIEMNNISRNTYGQAPAVATR
jgi:hypothetical protein